MSSEFKRDFTGPTWENFLNKRGSYQVYECCMGSVTKSIETYKDIWDAISRASYELDMHKELMRLGQEEIPVEKIDIWGKRKTFKSFEVVNSEDNTLLYKCGI